MLFELTIVAQAFNFSELLIDHLVTAIFVSGRLHSNDLIAIEYTIGIQREFNLKTIRRRQHSGWPAHLAHHVSCTLTQLFL